jgi:fatty-acyl-CoA synthase
MQVIDWLSKHSLYSPEKVALVETATGRRITYQEFNAEANRVANFLEGLGVKAGERVAILSGSCAEVLFVLFGVTKLGGIFLPLNFRLPAPELVPILNDAQPTILIYSDEFRSTVETLRADFPTLRTIKLNGASTQGNLSLTEEAARHSAEGSGKEIPVDLEAPQMLLYTSGTTGKPKGVILSHRMILWNAINYSVRDLWPTDTVLVHTPMFYTGGLNVYTLPAFFLGGRVVLMPAWNADQALETIEREQVTVFFAVPTQFLMLVDSPRFEKVDLRSLRYVISGGAPCPIPLIHRLIERGLTFKQGFGLTEVGPNCFALEARDALRKAGSIGFPNFSVEARLVDDDGRDVGPDEVGELILRTPAMCSGYWNNPDATAAAIRQGWFHTGDLARRDAEGYYYIVDRKKDMYISGGENVYPAQIEHVLLEHPKVEQAAVVGVPHAKWGEVGCAVIVLRAGEQATEEEILDFCRGKLAKFKLPKQVVFVQELPRTHSGKVQKQELKRRLV